MVLVGRIGLVPRVSIKASIRKHFVPARFFGLDFWLLYILSIGIVVHSPPIVLLVFVSGLKSISVQVNRLYVSAHQARSRDSLRAGRRVWHGLVRWWIGLAVELRIRVSVEVARFVRVV